MDRDIRPIPMPFYLPACLPASLSVCLHVSLSVWIEGQSDRETVGAGERDIKESRDQSEMYMEILTGRERLYSMFRMLGVVETIL